MSAKTTAKDRENPAMGKRLKQKREEMGITQRQMAEALGITIQGYQNYERGKEISSGRLVQICAVLECSPNWLLGYHNTGQHLAADSLLLKQLRAAFDNLNENGQQEAVTRVEELGEISRYTDKPAGQEDGEVSRSSEVSSRRTA